MNKIILIVFALLMVGMLSGCGIYGQGQTKGYIYAVDDGIVWDKVWFKSSLDSSESDCYLIDDNNLKSELRQLPAGTLIQLNYNRHFVTVAMCPEGTSTDDEIISYTILP